MINLLDIKISINRVLKNNFKLKIHPGEIKEGFKKPSFFVRIYPVKTEHNNINISTKILMIVIEYHPKKYNEIEHLSMIDKLEKAFGMILQVKSSNNKERDRFLRLTNIRNEEVDGTLQFKFNLSFKVNNNYSNDDEYELMRELHFRLLD